jgi:8-oxo-dGTP pyrophosphatase MutT (NUDIX family)
MNRPRFIEDGNYVFAGGVLFYRYNKNRIEVLVSKKKDQYEDIGGKTDPYDLSILHTAAREVEEETNAIIKSRHITPLLYKAKKLYSVQNKYVLYLVKANKYIRKLTTNQFHTHELLYDIPRTIHWVPLMELHSKKLHPRLYMNDISKFFISE